MKPPNNTFIRIYPSIKQSMTVLMQFIFTITLCSSYYNDAAFTEKKTYHWGV